MLENMKSTLIDAVKERYAVGLFNIINLEWTKAILEIHQEKNAPVILGVSERAAQYMGGFNTVFGMVTGLIKDLNVSVPVSLMLDHGSYEACQSALDAHFSSIMFDGSKYPIEENVKLTASIVRRAHQQGASVEAEVGKIGIIDNGVVNYGQIASPKECVQMMETGIDVLAAGIGNIHGEYPENWKGLDFDVLSDIKNAVGDLPIALHGGSGIPDQEIKRTILSGIAKINVGTELQIAFSKWTRKYFEEGKDLVDKGYDPRKIIKPGIDGIKIKVAEKLQYFGNINKAVMYTSAIN